MTWLAAGASGGAAGLGAWWFAIGPFAHPLARAELFAGVAVPLILWILGGAGALFVGMASVESTDDDREWWSRFGAWLFITIATWLVASIVVFAGPVLVHRVLGWIGGSTRSHTVGKMILAIIT